MKEKTYEVLYNVGKYALREEQKIRIWGLRKGDNLRI